MKYLLDTNICAFMFRGKYHVDKAIDRVGLQMCAISEITAFELMVGAELFWKKTGIDQREMVKNFISAIMVIPISDVLEIAAKEKVRLRLAGTPLDDNFDLIIGATAICYDMIMVTENYKDFKNLSNIRLENWIERQ